MSVAFEIAAGTSRALRRAVFAAHLTGIAGIVASAHALAGGGHPWLAAASSVVGAILVVRGLRHARRRVETGLLAVAPDGSALWRPAHGPAEPLEPLRWFRVGSLVWVDGRTTCRRVRLMSGRDRVPDDATWRRLLSWLRWLDRGGRGDAPLQVVPTGRK